jgi:hypothetical protein
VEVTRTDSPDPLIDVARADRLDEFHNDDSANERITGIGRRTYNGQTVERSYDLTFTEEKPLGTSPYAWRYTGVSIWQLNRNPDPLPWRPYCQWTLPQIPLRLDFVDRDGSLLVLCGDHEPIRNARMAGDAIGATCDRSSSAGCADVRQAAARARPS